MLWLNRFEGMDMRCVRLVPYEIDGRVFLDVQQIVPLPEAADYQVRVRRKDVARELVTAAASASPGLTLRPLVPHRVWDAP